MAALTPPQSTGIFLIEFAAGLLCEHFPSAGQSQALAHRFNKMMQQRYEETLNFRALHYGLSRHDDNAFWREVQKPEPIPSGLTRLLERWQTKPCNFTDLNDAAQLFGHLK